MNESVAAHAGWRFLGHFVIEHSNLFIVGDPYYLLRADRDEGHNRSWQPTYEDALERVERDGVAAIPTLMRSDGAPIGLVFDGFTEGRYEVHGKYDDTERITELTISLAGSQAVSNASDDAGRIKK